MSAFPDDAVAAALKVGHRPFHHNEELPVIFFRALAHEVNGLSAFSGHNRGLKIQADNFEQHFGNSRMHAVEDGHGTPRATLPLQPEYGRKLASEGARQCLAHSGMKHAGNPVARNRAGAKFDEIAA